MSTLMYVSDMLIADTSIKVVNGLKKKISKKFEMKDMGATTQILGMRILIDSSKGMLKLSQKPYILKVLNRFSVQDAKTRNSTLLCDLKLTKEDSPTTDEEKKQMATAPYASVAGSLMYVMVCTRFENSFAMGVVSRFFSNPGVKHWEAMKWLLRYLNGTSSMGLYFWKKGVKLEVFVDDDIGGDIDRSKIT